MKGKCWHCREEGSCAVEAKKADYRFLKPDNYIAWVIRAHTVLMFKGRFSKGIIKQTHTVTAPK